MPTRDELATDYLAQLPYPPYPLQEEALLAYFLSDQGVLMCAPTGTGKTLVAHAALYEALRTDGIAYYTTPLIALTEQKFQELQALVESWGFAKTDIGLISGNRKVNPSARVLVVVAEILLNRLLNQDGFDFSRVQSVVMDEFHSFADPERGIVWELSLSLLPPHVRLLLLSATVGNAVEFLSWLSRMHGRQLELVEGRERKIPLTYHWAPDLFLNDLLVEMAHGDDARRKTPALVFAFNRDECWSIAEQLKGLDLVNAAQRGPLHKAVDALDWPQGVGPKLKQMLRRGVGVHHAGLLPKYRRGVEDLFEQKLLSVALCTETLAAGINLPARSVVLTSLVKGPFGKEKVIDASSAHQIFGRAGRPQFDTEGHVFALPHEDDVRIAKWKEKYDQIPDASKDPAMLKKKKELLRKKPARNSQKKYWTATDFEKLQVAAPAKLYSKGPLPWRLLAYLLQISPEVERIRTVIRKRLLDGPRVEAGMKQLHRMLAILEAQGYATLDPPIPVPEADAAGATGKPAALPEGYAPVTATPTPELAKLLAFRAVHPLYGAFLVKYLGVADENERLQLFESVLELPRPLLKFVRVPWDTPPGPLATMLEPELVSRGLVVAKPPPSDDDEPEEEGGYVHWEDRPPVLAQKLRLLFDATHPDVTDVSTEPVWGAGELLSLGGNFNTYVTARDLGKQEGLIFRHCLRLVLLTEEFSQLAPPDTDPAVWQAELRRIADRLTETCRAVDPFSTEQAIQKAHAADVVEGESHAAPVAPTGDGAKTDAEVEAEFGAGLFGD